MKSRWLGLVVAWGLALVAAAAADTVLDYGYYKSRVEPIFLKKRADHVRCYVCHLESNNDFKLVKLSPGSKNWSDEESRRNFEVASKLVVPGDPEKSVLLLRPLAPEAGGLPYHSGGRQFETKNDPNWKILAQWVSGKKQAAAGK